jgi:hypothetical protein
LSLLFPACPPAFDPISLGESNLGLQRGEPSKHAAQLAALSQSKPVLMIFDDVHWIDPTSLEALNRAIERIRTLGVLPTLRYLTPALALKAVAPFPSPEDLFDSASNTIHAPVPCLPSV